MSITQAGITRVLEVLHSDMTHISVENAGGEVNRKQIATSLIDGNTLIEEIYYSETELVGQIINKVFLIANGTDTPSTGTKIVEEEALETKTDKESLTISLEITVMEVL